jgi:adenine-specific DNA-methyltransferase
MKKKPIQYNITPAKGQALLNFQGRRYPDKVDLFETEKIEEVRNRKENPSISKDGALYPDFTNLLIQGDCLSACAYLKSKNIKVDLVYIDPPFASGANYAKKIYLRNGGKNNIDNDSTTIGEEVMYGDIWQKEDYLNWLYERLLAIKKVMNEAASIYVHLDWHIGHYVKILMDEVFGEENFKNEIIWQYQGSWVEPKNNFPKRHQIIYYYSKSELYNFNLTYDNEYVEKGVFKRWEKYLKDGKIYGNNYPKNDGKFEPYLNSFIEKNNRQPKGEDIIVEFNGPQAGTVWYISTVNPISPENQYYITQKPQKLLERIIETSSEKGMIVADFFSGSGTTAKVANELGRKFIACDIGINAIQTSRDRLVEADVDFDVLKIKDGLRLFRNPAQTTAKIFSIIDGFKNRTELELNEFWDGGIAQENGTYTPIKFSGIHEKLTKELLDVFLEEIYILEDTSNRINEVIIIYAYKDFEIDQQYLNKKIHESGKSTLIIKLISLDSLLGEKGSALFTQDNATVEATKQGSKYKVEIKNYFSPYLKNKIDDYNVKKTKKGTIQQDLSNVVKISENGLELIEAIQFDTTLDKFWKSNKELEDKAGIKEKIKGTYFLDTDNFKIKIRNIAGDEIIINSKDL